MWNLFCYIFSLKRNRIKLLEANVLLGAKFIILSYGIGWSVAKFHKIIIFALASSDQGRVLMKLRWYLVKRVHLQYYSQCTSTVLTCVKWVIWNRNQKGNTYDICIHIRCSLSSTVSFAVAKHMSLWLKHSNLNII